MMPIENTTDFAQRSKSKAALEQGILPMPTLAYNDEVAALTAPIYEKLRPLVSLEEWFVHAPYIAAINKLKKERGAVILAHNYQSPEIFHGVADIRGDSLQLAIEAASQDADLIVQCGVHFMAETSKILCPEKTILIPDCTAGCSLASSINAEDVRALRKAHPGVPIITYVNTSAEVKAECDICCTSSNAVQVVESLGVDRVLLVPDQYLARNVANQTDVEVLTFNGSCEVHERFKPEALRQSRKEHPGMKIIAHPECPPEVVAEADYSGSTMGMINWVLDNKPEKVLMVTEKSMAENLRSEAREVSFVPSCNACSHMKKITLPKILDTLLYMREEVVVDPAIAEKARISVKRMIDLKL